MPWPSGWVHWICVLMAESWECGFETRPRPRCLIMSLSNTRHFTIIAFLHPGVNGYLWGQSWLLCLISPMRRNGRDLRWFQEWFMRLMSRGNNVKRCDTSCKSAIKMLHYYVGFWKDLFLQNTSCSVQIAHHWLMYDPCRVNVDYFIHLDYHKRKWYISWSHFVTIGAHVFEKMVCFLATCCKFDKIILYGWLMRVPMLNQVRFKISLR